MIVFEIALRQPEVAGAMERYFLDFRTTTRFAYRARWFVTVRAIVRKVPPRTRFAWIFTV